MEDTGFLAAKPSRFPVDQNLVLMKEGGELLADASQYRRLVGMMIYLTITRPDLVYAVQILSQFMDKPWQTHVDAARQFYGMSSKLVVKAFSYHLKESSS